MLTEDQKRLLIEKIENGEPLPPEFRRLLVDAGDGDFVERTGVYTLEYKGKAREQDILADTPAAPLQEIRSFNAGNPHAQKDWRNLLIYGDNLLALKALYEDQRGPNRFGTRDKIKLIYIDPPFATKQDFMKDREKAYRDKLIGAQFIEFLRRRLVLLREVLADDGSIYVHLDTKKSHYLKAVLDEIFGEENFQNEIVWERTNAHNMPTKTFARAQDTLFLYSKSDIFTFNKQRSPYGEAQLSRFKRDESGRLYTGRDLTFSTVNRKRQFEWRGSRPPSNRSWGLDLDGLEDLWSKGLILKKRDGAPRLDGLKTFLDDLEGKPLTTIWNDIGRVANTSGERTDYPTQKPEQLLERIIQASSNDGDIVLDAFMGSGSTPAVAEKLNRHWIGIDCGRLAIYTTQKRLLNLTSQIGAEKKDERREYERVEDFPAHSKSGAKAALLLFDKAKAGELAVTDALLTDFAAFLCAHYSPQRGRTPEFSLFCPEDKLQLRKLKSFEDSDLKAGQRAVDVGGVRFLISFIEPKTKAEPAKPLKAKAFALFNAGVYDRDRIRELDWAAYKPFVMQLFGVREDSHLIRAFEADGYIGTNSVHVWNYPDQRSLALDEGYIESLHQTMRGEGGDRFYVIAPVSALTFMTDELRFGNTRYVILKVPESVLNSLLKSGTPGALKQPMSEGDVNAVIDAVGFDFVSQPLTEQQFLRLPPQDADLANQHLREGVVRLTEFRAKTLTTAPDDFPNFATLSMVMIDPAFDGDVFSLGQVLWAEDLAAAELKRLDVTVNGEFAAKAEACERLDIRVPEEGMGARVMVILVDQYGNEKRLEISRGEFVDPTVPAPSRRGAARKNATKVAKKTVGKATKKVVKKMGKTAAVRRGR